MMDPLAHKECLGPKVLQDKMVHLDSAESLEHPVYFARENPFLPALQEVPEDVCFPSISFSNSNH